MASPTYNRSKYYRIMDRTQSNYSNQYKRLLKNGKRADNILIYYSISLIVYSLTVNYFEEYFSERVLSFSSIILSIIVLTFSIINSNAAYPERAAKIQDSLNKVKQMKREVGDLPANISFEGDPSQEQLCAKCKGKDAETRACEAASACFRLEEIKARYDQVVSGTEIRDDLDFYFTIRNLCETYNLNWRNGKMLAPKNGDPKELTAEEKAEIEEIRGYIAENNPVHQRRYLAATKAVHALLYFAPVLVYALSFAAKRLGIFN